ncbi:MAG TPA: nascent polypeptide-associated complex protein [Candidatus Norongarragalinales archaeon]|nr:nascent polypeptide-associated complex protein [Candidatus Norongarragalinales archaeon]
MSRLMSQMGIKSQEIPSDRVTIEKRDGGKIVIENPSVTAIDMQGQKSFQIMGTVKEEAERTESDADLVAREAGVSRAAAEKALEESGGDIAEAIMLLEQRK